MSTSRIEFNIYAKTISMEPLLKVRLSMVNLLVKIACFLRKEKYISITKSRWPELASARRLTILSLPFGRDSLPYLLATD